MNALGRCAALGVGDIALECLAQQTPGLFSIGSRQHPAVDDTAQGRAMGRSLPVVFDVGRDRLTQCAPYWEKSMAFVVTKTVHVDHDDIADMFVEGAYHQDQAALFNAISRRFSGDEPKHLETMAGEMAKHLDDSGRTLIRAPARALLHARS